MHDHERTLTGRIGRDEHPTSEDAWSESGRDAPGRRSSKGRSNDARMTLLDGRAALVTGAANGIGRAIAERLAAEGARVAAVDVEACSRSRSLRARGALGPVGDRVARWAARGRPKPSIGPIDVLVNNAGVFEPALAVDLTLDSYRACARGQPARAGLPREPGGSGMIERGYGRIVNITSVHGRFGEETAISYDVAKGGLEQATRTLAVELSRHGVLVNAVAPGFVATRMSVVDGKDELESDWFNDVYVKYGKIPIRRYAMPDEIAEHVAWLGSERNTYMTGQVLTVDGGLTVTF